ncbi:lipoate--protein ligase [Diplocloster modestus]|uniref:lipoate--protein ligase n=1 Tax=Diplocloster modestus TaxID=2850322 RepID=A0ABS6KBR5_9FIRM|nr:lipoate--protein ligase [Diplocloster modestus]MBU9727950.1 lipoate--protein ligase [Diplocloster modestus]
MMNKRTILVHNGTNPYRNLALENYLMDLVEEHECILYLWQNRRTVVIGRNQNAWKECRTKSLSEDGGFLARRLSGGGAVFHDLGNLNFTFIARQPYYDVDRQLAVILEAVRMCEIRAEKSGRNDLEAEGRKFSGNAFYQAADVGCHHGTLLIRVDQQQLARYLNVSSQKLKAKSVDSVRSRVVNLADLNPQVTVAGMKEKLEMAFAKVYEGPVRPMDPSRIRVEKLEALENKFSSWEWNYGQRHPFQHEISHRFAWGEVQLHLAVNDGKVHHARIYSDALDTEYIPKLAAGLDGVLYEPESLKAAVQKVSAMDPMQETMRQDITGMLPELFE